jgi:hypothetical protein
MNSMLDSKSGDSGDDLYAIILYDESAQKIKYYSMSAQGLLAAVLAASNGDIVWIPAGTIDFSGGAYTPGDEISTGAINVTSEIGHEITGLVVGEKYAIESWNGYFGAGTGYPVIYSKFSLSDGSGYSGVVGQGIHGAALPNTISPNFCVYSEMYVGGDDKNYGRTYFQATTTSVWIRVQDSIGNYGDNFGTLSWRLREAEFGDSITIPSGVELVGLGAQSIINGNLVNEGILTNIKIEGNIGGAGRYFIYNSDDKIVTNRQFRSEVTAGIAPFEVESTTLINYLNSDLLDGYHAEDLPTTIHDHSGDSGDGGSFFLTNLSSGDALEGQVATADGTGGIDFTDLLADADKISVLTENISNPPTYSELTALFGVPEDAGTGFIRILNDTAASVNTYLVYSDGSLWWSIPFAKMAGYSAGIPILNKVIFETNVTTGLGSDADNAARVPAGQRQAFYANDRYWLFYGVYSGSAPYNLNFISSIDGNIWADPTNLGTFPVADAQWNIAFDGTYVHIVKNIQSAVPGIFHDGLLYRVGEPESDGTITWLADWQTVIATGTFVGDHSLSVDTNGHAWFAYGNAGSNTNPVQGDVVVLKNANTDGTWSNASGFPVTVTSNNDGRFGTLCALNDGGMYLVARKWEADTPALGFVSTGNSTFTAEGSITVGNVQGPTSGGERIGMIDVASYNGSVHFVYQSDFQKIIYGKRNADGSFENEVEVGTANTFDTDFPRVSFSSKGTVFILWPDTANERVLFARLKSGNWSTVYILFSEVMPTIRGHLMPAILANGNYLQIVSLTADNILIHRLVNLDI